MNILQAYINQFSKLNIIFLSVDYDLLRDLVYNLSKDFRADIIDLFPIMDDLNNIDSKKINNMMRQQNPIKFILSPIFPRSKYLSRTDDTSYTKNFRKKHYAEFSYDPKINLPEYFRNRINVDIDGGSMEDISAIPQLDFSSGVLNIYPSYIINISLNKYLLEEKKINQKYINLENKYSKYVKVNKYFNLSKYKSNIKLEDDIFNNIIEFIEKKLDKGEYLKNKVITDSDSESYDKKSSETQDKKLKTKKVKDSSSSETLDTLDSINTSENLDTTEKKDLETTDTDTTKDLDITETTDKFSTTEKKVKKLNKTKKLKNINTKEILDTTESSENLDTTEKKDLDTTATNTTEDVDISEDNEFSEKFISKKINHDKKEKYLEKKNKKFDEEILDEVDDLSDSIYNEENQEDNEDLIYENLEYAVGGMRKLKKVKKLKKKFQKIDDDESSDDALYENLDMAVRGIRKIKKRYGVMGKRVIKKKMK